MQIGVINDCVKRKIDDLYGIRTLPRERHPKLLSLYTHPVTLTYFSDSTVCIILAELSFLINISPELTLRSFDRADAAELFAVVDQNRAYLRPWLSWVDATLKPEHSLAFIEDSLRQAEEQQGIVLGIFLEGKIIGSIGMYQWQQTLRKAQIGYWIAREQQGKGVMTQCLRPFIHFLFHQLGLNKIEIHFLPTNARSAVIAQKFYAKIEGILRDSYLSNGKLCDLVIAGILKSEWEQSNATR